MVDIWHPDVTEAMKQQLARVHSLTNGIAWPCTEGLKVLVVREYSGAAEPYEAAGHGTA
jgi:hypothetical protein